MSPQDYYGIHSFESAQTMFTFDEPASSASTPDDLATTSTTVEAPYYMDYSLEIEAECAGLSSSVYTFNLRSWNPCVKADLNWINIPATTLDTEIYKINSDKLIIPIEDIAS